MDSGPGSGPGQALRRNDERKSRLLVDEYRTPRLGAEGHSVSERGADRSELHLRHRAAQGTLSFLGRAQYLNGQLAPARDTLQKALAAHKSDHLARLYLGLTVARQGDQQSGLRDIQAGTKGIGDFLNYIANSFSSTFGQYWDPNGDIRKAASNNLALMARPNVDWPTFFSSSEALALNFEQEPDRARRQEEQQIEMDRRR